MPGNDDFAAMEEVLTRRLTAYLAERAQPGRPSAPGKFSYPPQLLLVDGGKGQLNVAVRVLEELGLDEEIPVASLAKRFEEVYVPGEADPVRIPRESEALYLLQRIRDEAHRFAITYHRELRGKRMTKSVLDDIKGLGPTRTQAADEGAGRRDRGARRRRSTSCRRCRGCPTPSPRRSTTRSTASGVGRGSGVVTGPALRASEPPRPGRRVGAATPPGGRPGSPTAPTPSTTSRSCRWPPATWPGPPHVLDVGSGEGQIARLAVGRRRRRVVGVDPTGAQIARGAGAAGGGPAYARAVGRRACPFAVGAGSTPSSPASCSSTSTTSTAPSTRWPGCCARAAGSSSSSTTRCSRRRAAAGSTTRSSTRPSSTGGSGPYLVEDGHGRGGRAGRAAAVRPPPAEPLRERPGRTPACSSPAWTSRRRRPGFLARRREYQDAATIPRLLLLRAERR